MPESLEALRRLERPTEATMGCQVCGGSRFQTRARIDRHHLMRCVTCGLLCVRKSSGLDQAADYYEDVDYEAWAACYEEFKIREFRGILNEVRRFGAGPRLLDVGCSYGWFVREALALGFDAQGLEPSSIVAEIAQAHGLQGRVHIGDATSLEGREGEVDIITFLDVLEHLQEPRRALRAARARLSSKGLLVVRVPDVDGIIHRTALWSYRMSWGRLRAPLEALAQVENDFMHLFFFTRGTLDRLLRVSGFQVVAMQGCELFDERRLDDRVQLSGRSNRYARWNHPAVRWGLSTLKAIGRLVGSPDEMVVYARPA